MVQGGCICCGCFINSINRLIKLINIREIRMHSHRHQDYVYYDFRPNTAAKTNKPISKRRNTHKTTENTPPARPCNTQHSHSHTSAYFKPELAVSKGSDVESGLAAMQMAVSKQETMFQRFCLGAFIQMNRTHETAFNHCDLFQGKPDSPTRFFSELHCDPDESPLFCSQTASDLQKADAPSEVELDYDVSAYFTD